MKKHNEGYTLVLVLVVMLVLTTVATAILTFSVSNLKNQQAMVERMEAKYEAMGAIEAAMAQLDNLEKLENCTGKNIEEAQAILQEEIVTICENLYLQCDVKIVPDFLEWPKIEPTSDVFEYKCSIVSESLRITCAFNISGKITSTDADIAGNKKYTFSEMKIELTSYEIGGAAS